MLRYWSAHDTGMCARPLSIKSAKTPVAFGTLVTKYPILDLKQASTRLLGRRLGFCLTVIARAEQPWKGFSKPAGCLAMNLTRVILLLSALLTWCYEVCAKAVFAHFMVWFLPMRVLHICGD